MAKASRWRDHWAPSADEHRATITGINLFFSALLGANLGALGGVPPDDYFKLVLMLAGAATAVLTIAVTRRWKTALSSAVALLFVLAVISLIPGVFAARLDDDLDRMALTFLIWLVMLLVMRLSPQTSEGPAAETTLDEDSLPLPREH